MLQKEALELMKMGYNVFLTGEAGSGKTFVLNKYIDFLRSKNIAIGITASTGIAATHIDGVTLDSWSGLGIKEEISELDIKILSQKRHLVKRLTASKVLIIDEISMISGLRFDLVDKILRRIRNCDTVFGGLQVILCGDLFQLPPVSSDRSKSDFIFLSRAWNELNLQICYLSEAIRQHKDREFLKVLSDIRHNTVTDMTKKVLYQSLNETPKEIFPTKLYTHNIDVDRINNLELAKIHSETHVFYMTSLGPPKLTEMMKRTCLAPSRLELKKGALVMFVRNNFSKGYFNGTLGKIVGFSHNDDPEVETLDKQKITVLPDCWSIEEENKIVAQITQLPLRLAWAITVHKSQGMTLDSAEIDLSKSFLEGMGYVALSRVKSLKRLRLLGINEMAMKVNSRVSEFDKQLLIDDYAVVKKIKSLGLIGGWWKKWKFMYKLTSI